MVFFLCWEPMQIDFLYAGQTQSDGKKSSSMHMPQAILIPKKLQKATQLWCKLGLASGEGGTPGEWLVQRRAGAVLSLPTPWRHQPPYLKDSYGVHVFTAYCRAICSGIKMFFLFLFRSQMLQLLFPGLCLADVCMENKRFQTRWKTRFQEVQSVWDKELARLTNSMYTEGGSSDTSKNSVWDFILKNHKMGQIEKD